MSLTRAQTAPRVPLDGTAPPAAPLPALALSDVLAKRHGMVLLDGAVLPNLTDMLEADGVEHHSLWGEDDDTVPFGPWLAVLDPANPFARKLFTRSDAPWHLWGRSRPVFLHSPAGAELVAEHLKPFVRMRDPEGHIRLFRFWDGAVFSGYADATQDRPERLHRFFGQWRGVPLISAFWTPSPDTADALVAYRLAALPDPAAPLLGPVFDAEDMQNFRIAADRQMLARVADRLAKGFDRFGPDHGGQPATYADGALKFIRRYGPGQSQDIEQDCIELAMLAFLLGPNWSTVLNGPLMRETMIPISKRIAMLKQSYLTALATTPQPDGAA
jgi:hypothetical protein